MQEPGPIGVFDSGYGGLTVFKELEKELPDYDFIYLGDNARVPYGTRSFETVYKYTRSCVNELFEMGCHLVILACNTASAKALRAIQRKDLKDHKGVKKVLGVLRPTTERAGELTQNGHLGILATEGTVKSESYLIEIARFFPEVVATQHACPMWVPLVENGEHDSLAAEFYVRKNLQELFEKDQEIDSILLACTHYPILAPIIRKVLPPEVNLISQGPIVAESLVDYLKRHAEVDALCSKKGFRAFFTTDSPSDFEEKAALFMGHRVTAQSVSID